MADGSDGRRPPRPRPKWQQPFGVGPNGQVSHFRPVMSPGLKLPTQSQLADDLQS